MKDFLTEAAEEAWRGTRKGHGGPFGAVILKGRRVIARAHNSVLQKKDPTCHAEMEAIRKAARRLKTPFLTGCVVFSTTEPCPMCFAALHWAHVRGVIYSTTIADVKKLGFNELTVSNSQLKKWGRSKIRISKKKNLACRLLLRRWQALPSRMTY